MDPMFASVLLGFFSLIVAIVAIVYKQNDVAKAAIKGSKEVSDFRKQKQNRPQR